MSEVGNRLVTKKAMVKIREINRSNIAEVKAAVSFHNAAYGTKRTSEQWFWEYEGNVPNRSVFTIIEDEDGIGATQGMIPIYLNINGQKYLSGKSENTLLSPKHRGGSLSQELYEFALSLCKSNNMSFVWGFTPAEKVWKKKFGFSTYNTMFFSILILNPFRFLSVMKSKLSPLKSIVMLPLILLTYIYSFTLRYYQIFSNNSPFKRFSIEEKPRSIDDLKLLYDRLRGKYPNLIHIDQDENYLNWRIVCNPNIICKKNYFVYEDNILKGYCYITSSNTTTAFITDLTFETREAGSYLLNEILKTLNSGKISHLIFLGNQQNRLIANVFALLTKFGFLRKRTAPFVFRNISGKDDSNLYDIENWYLNGLWTEGYE